MGHVEPVEPSVLVDALCVPWGGTSEAAVSAVDVLLCDALENEDRPRPEDGIVRFDAGRHGFRAEDLAHWTMGWPRGPSLFARMLGRGERTIAARLERDEREAVARIEAFRAMRATLGAIPWATIAPMEVVSLAMGHYGPSRQPAGWGVSTPWLHATAARIAGSAFGRSALATSAGTTASLYEPAMREIAADSLAAIAELGRRASVGDPLSRPIRSFLPLLGGTMV